MRGASFRCRHRAGGGRGPLHVAERGERGGAAVAQHVTQTGHRSGRAGRRPAAWRAASRRPVPGTVVPADPSGAEEPGDDRRDGGLRPAPRWGVRAGVGAAAARWSGQGLVVRLAVAGEREPGQDDEGVRHHGGGKPVTQMGAQRRLRRLVAGGGDVGDEPGRLRGRRGVGALPDDQGSGVVGGVDGDGAGGDSGVAGEYRLDLGELHAYAADLHLPVHPAQVLQLAVRQYAYGVPGAVEAGAVGAEGVGDERGGGARRVTEVPAADDRVPDEQLARHPARHAAAAVLAQDVQIGVADGRADRQRASPRRRRGDSAWVTSSEHSVGPYTLASAMPGWRANQRAHSSVGSASPLEIIQRSADSSGPPPAASHTSSVARSREGTTSRTVSRWPRSASRSRAPSGAGSSAMSGPGRRRAAW